MGVLALKVSAAKVSQAEAQVKATQDADARALAESQAKLKRVIYGEQPGIRSRTAQDTALRVILCQRRGWSDST